MATVAMGHVDVKLSRPVKIAGVDVATLRMREVTLGDQLAVQKMAGDEADKEIALLANLCSLAPTDLHVLPMRDYAALQKALRSFFD
jgi:hypothetical protein